MGLGSNTASYTRPSYRHAATVWEDRFSAARRIGVYWRIAALLSLTLAVGLGAGLVYIATHPQLRTYIIELDRLGQPARVTLADGAYEPTEAQTGYFLAELVRRVRTRSLDPVVLRQNWTAAYRFLGGDAVNTMNIYARRDAEAAAAVGQPLARTVEISNVLARSPRSYQVRWTETTYIAGGPQPAQAYTGVFQVELRPPRDEADVFHNPLGLIVVSFSWSREFDTLDKPAVPTQPKDTHETPED